MKRSRVRRSVDSRFFRRTGSGTKLVNLARVTMRGGLRF